MHVNGEDEARLMPVASFWAGGNLPALDRACLASFANAGHAVTLYSFEKIAGMPANVTLADAREIVAKETLHAFIFEGRSNFSHFSDYFRYKLFATRGDAWVDTDLLLLRPIPDAPGNLFAKETPTGICGAIMRIGADDPKLAELLRRTESLMHTELVWGATGPRLLNKVLGEKAILSQARPPSCFFPIHYDDFFKPLLPEDAEECEVLCQDAHTLHLWNNIIVRLGYWKEMAPPAGSFLWRKLHDAGLLSLFRDSYPEDVMQNMVANWKLRKSGGDIGVAKLMRQFVPSVVRTATPRVRALLQQRH
jgi:hypothetical protein